MTGFAVTIKLRNSSLVIPPDPFDSVGSLRVHQCGKILRRKRIETLRKARRVVRYVFNVYTERQGSVKYELSGIIEVGGEGWLTGPKQSEKRVI